MPDEAATPKAGRYPIEDVFAFGLWGGAGPAPSGPGAGGKRYYTLGFEDLLRDMRRMSMNCLVYGPVLGHEPDALARFAHEIALCGRYGVDAVPSAGEGAAADVARLADVAGRFRDAPAILGWYIRDEPPPEFVPDFLRCRDALAAAAPRHPALCLFYRPDSVADFAPHQPAVLTDCYPIGYVHDGVSLGPHFGIRSGPLALARGMGRFNPWGVRGILEWMDLCRALCGDRPHWITLQTFESGDGREVRWREPTAPELRLETWLAVAGGAKGITYFHYMLAADAYGNPRPALHGEGTPLLEEIGRLGAQLAPLGELLVDAEVAEPLALVASRRPTPDPGARIEVRRLRSRTRDVDYLVALNFDTRLRSTAQAHLDRGFLRGRGVYDLAALAPVLAEDLPGALALGVALGPGEGRIFAIASEKDARVNEAAILDGRCRNEAAVMEMDLDLAQRSGLDVADAARLATEYRARAESGDHAAALALVRRAARAVGQAMRRDARFRAAHDGLDYAKRTLGRLARAGGLPPEQEERIGAAYAGLRGLYRQGAARRIATATARLRELVEELEAAAAAGEPPKVDETALIAIERAASPARKMAGRAPPADT